MVLDCSFSRNLTKSQSRHWSPSGRGKSRMSMVASVRSISEHRYSIRSKISMHFSSGKALMSCIWRNEIKATRDASLDRKNQSPGQDENTNSAKNNKREKSEAKDPPK